MISEAQPDPVLVLGSTGRLGRALRDLWQGRANVIWQARDPGHDLAWTPGARWTGPAQARAIVALWGVVPGAGDLSDNTRLALDAMELGAALGADRVLHCSSSAVYAPCPDPQREDCADPQNDYGKAKLAMEHALADWGAAHPGGPASCAMRIGNFAGADSVFAAIARGGPVTMDRFANRRGPLRSYLSHQGLAGCVDALLACPRNGLPGVVNVANRGAVDMADIARAAGRQVIWRDAPDPTGGAVVLDLTRLCGIVDPGPTDAAALVADAVRIQGARA